ncbi:MAG: nucleotide exchange factor GrpE, partial [Nitrososphaerota archaeon]
SEQNNEDESENPQTPELEIGSEDNPNQNDKLMELEQSLTSCEDKLKRSIADFMNLERKTKNDIEKGVNEQLDKFLLKFLTAYDDLVRAKEILKKEDQNVQGLDSIIKNIDSLLSEYGITPINALGEIFDPNLHEAISIIQDDSLDDNTVTKEIRKGYISHKRTLRPTLVEISKKLQTK